MKLPLRIRLLLPLPLCLILFSSCNRFHSNDSALGTNGARIVCISQQLTEMICALGGGDKLVGVDLSSTYPPQVTKLPTVGYHRMLNVEGITSLNPTLVIHDGNIAPDAVLKQIQQIGIPVRQFPQANTIEETKSVLRLLAAELNTEVIAESLCAKLDENMRIASVKRAHCTDTPKVLLIHFGRVINNYLVVGQGNLASTMIEWAGGVNVMHGPEGMKPLSAEIIAEAQPDVILATDFGYDRTGGVENFKKLPGIALTPAAKNNKIFRVEEHDLMHLGPRTGENVLRLMNLIHGNTQSLSSSGS